MITNNVNCWFLFAAMVAAPAYKRQARFLFSVGKCRFDANAEEQFLENLVRTLRGKYEEHNTALHGVRSGFRGRDKPTKRREQVQGTVSKGNHVLRTHTVTQNSLKCRNVGMVLSRNQIVLGRAFRCPVKNVLAWTPRHQISDPPLPALPLRYFLILQNDSIAILSGDHKYSCIDGCQVNRVKLQCGSSRKKAGNINKRGGETVSVEFELEIGAQSVTGW